VAGCGVSVGAVPFFFGCALMSGFAAVFSLTSGAAAGLATDVAATSGFGFFDSATVAVAVLATCLAGFPGAGAFALTARAACFSSGCLLRFSTLELVEVFVAFVRSACVLRLGLAFAA
jgi:hypothetical protein